MPITLEKVQVHRVDDVPLLLEYMVKLDWPNLLNRQIGRHPNQIGLDLGWVIVIWLSYILTEGDHRKEVVQEWVASHQEILERICGIEIQPNHFTDDRLSIALRYLSDPSRWQGIEAKISQGCIQLYDLKTRVVRHDATTVSGYHEVKENALFQFGHSKDDPTRPQLKVMVSVAEPLGLPLVTLAVPGSQSDDGLYWPSIAASRAQLEQSGLLHVGDSKLSALANRAQVHQAGDYYLCPLPMTGNTPGLMELWIDRGLAGHEAMELVEQTNLDGSSAGVIAEGYELEREMSAVVSGETLTWTERVFIVYSPSDAQRQTEGLQKRLDRASEKILNLTPPAGRGIRVYRDLAALQAKVEAILEQAQVTGLLAVEYEHSLDAMGRDRYEIAQLLLVDDEIEAVQERLGWRPYVSNAPKSELSLEEAVLTYRGQWKVEQIFGRFKGKQLSIAPMFVKREDQILGLTHLMSLAVRIYVLIQFVVRRSLATQGETLTGLYPGKPRKATAEPTTERLLQAFRNFNVTSVMVNGERITHAPELSLLQKKIIHALGLPEDTYSKLAGHYENST